MFVIQRLRITDQQHWVTVWEGESYQDSRAEWKQRTTFCVQSSGVLGWPESGVYRLLKDGEVELQRRAEHRHY